MPKHALLLVGLALALLGGCVAPAPGQTVSVGATAVATQVVVTTARAVPDASPTAAPTAADAATATPPPTATLVPEPTPPPTATPTPTHSLMIEVMRRQAYPGSNLVIERTFDPAATYSRHIAHYDSEGLRIYALLTVPTGPKPESGWPAIVFNHGYIAPDVYRTTERYLAYVDTFARNGYIVLKPDYRGHDRSEGEPANIMSSPAYTVDVLNAVGALTKFPHADPERIGMWGHSMGGEITLRAMVVSDEIKAGVIWAGMVASQAELLEWRRWRWVGRPTPTPGSRGDGDRFGEDLIAQYGAPAENPAFWASISSASYLEDLSGPIQLHHGTADESVPVEYSEDLDAAIREAGGTVELHLYPGDNHNIGGNLGLALSRSVAFFDRYVK